jgi:hypothetical protein
MQFTIVFIQELAVQASWSFLQEIRSTRLCWERLWLHHLGLTAWLAIKGKDDYTK